MSTDSEREIRARLGTALGTIAPPEPPTAAVVRQGRTIKLRRRAVVAAGLAAVVGLGIALPGLVGHPHSAPSLTRRVYRVTLNPPQNTPKKLTFAGTINGRPWRFEDDWNGGDVMETGPAQDQNDLSSLTPGDEPANLVEVAVGSRLNVTGQVGKDVRYLAFNQPGGRVIYVYPNRWHGQRWAGVSIPAGQRLRSVVAYSSQGEVGYAVPFLDNTINAWLKPGQRGLARQTLRIAAGKVDGKRWSYTGYAGPWGICFRGTEGGACSSAYSSNPSPRQLLRWDFCGPLVGVQQWTGQAALEVSYLRFRLSDGRVLRVDPVTMDGYRFFAMEFRGHLTGWTAYGAAGQVLGSGSVPKIC